jgi:AraC-like DNA-binding protein
MEKALPSFSNYLPVEADALKWGLHVIDAGNTEIPPHTPYPPGQHPEEYTFSWDKGRILDEYQLVYITKGQGIFETKETGKVRISAGKIFLLYPGIWHRYRPTQKTGWDESWIGFSGEVADRIMSAFFPSQKAIITIGYDQELQELILSIAQMSREAIPGYQQMIAARTMEALAIVRSRAMTYHAADRDAAHKIQQARYYLLNHCTEEIDMEKLALKLGLSYSRFRSLFREHTGTAPHQYLLGIKLNKARELLRHTDLPVGDIADRAGFASAYYFSRLFKNKTGLTPSDYRTGQVK